MPTVDTISEITRRHIFDQLTLDQIWWFGRLNEIDFLAHLYDLNALPSEDPRYTTAREDIIQHRVNNSDWDDGWFLEDHRFNLLNGPDETFVKFLELMLHPITRREPHETQQLVDLFNTALGPDGWELASSQKISGRQVFKGRKRQSFHRGSPELALDDRPLLTDARVLHEHLSRIRNGIDADPAAAIGSCKELLESLTKMILEDSGAGYASGADLPALYKQVAGVLGLNAETIPDSVKGSDAVRKILRTLTTTIQGLSEMRNAMGVGHGRTSLSPALTRHALLAFNSTVAVAEFLLDTWQDRIDRGKFPKSSSQD